MGVTISSGNPVSSPLSGNEIIPVGGANTPTVTAQQIADLAQNINTRVQSDDSTSTLTPNVDDYDMAVLTAQGEALTIANPTGTPSNGNGFVFRIKDDGTARAIGFGNLYRGVGSALPTTTTLGKEMYFAAVYNSVGPTWDVFPSQVEP